MREQLDARTEALRKAEALLEQFQHRMPDVELADVLDSAEPPAPTTPSKGACVEVTRGEHEGKGRGRRAFRGAGHKNRTRSHAHSTQ